MPRPLDDTQVTEKCPKRTHEGKVGLVDLGESVVACVEVSGLFGQRGHAVQLQVVAVDRGTKARAQETRGHTWGTIRAQ